MMYWTHIEETTPVARKEHECHLCGRPIAKGEKHHKHYGISSEVGRCSLRSHVACLERTRDWGHDEWESHDVGEFRAQIEEEERERA